MKTFLCLIVAFLIFSCTKNDHGAISNSGVHKYTLSFQVENESNANYYIQTSPDGVHFTSVDSITVDPSKNGNYSYELNLTSGKFVRIAAGTDSETSLSAILKAD